VQAVTFHGYFIKLTLLNNNVCPVLYRTPHQTVLLCGTKQNVALKRQILLYSRETECIIDLPNATHWNSYYYAMDKIGNVIDQCAKDNDCEVFSTLLKL
jgi:hypothetical protein